MPGQDSGSALIFHPGHLSWSVVLSGHAAPQGQAPPYSTVLRSHRSSGCQSLGQVPVVTPPHGCLERQGDFRLSNRLHTRVRLQHVGLGCLLCRLLYRGRLDARGTREPHQLLGAHRSFFHGSEFHLIMLHAVTDGQRFHSPLHQSPWRITVQAPKRFDHGFFQIYRAHAICRRLFPPFLEGYERLATVSTGIQPPFFPQRSFLYRTLRLPLEPLAFQLLQLAPEPEGFGGGRLQPDVAPDRGLCLSPLCHDSPPASPGLSSPADPPGDYPPLALSTLVSGSPQALLRRLPSTHPCSCGTWRVSLILSSAWAEWPWWPGRSLGVQQLPGLIRLPAPARDMLVPVVGGLAVVWLDRQIPLLLL